MKISLAERTSAKMRLDFQEAEQQRDQFQSEASPYLLLDKLVIIFSEGTNIKLRIMNISAAR